MLAGVNRCESAIKTVNLRQAKAAETLEPKGKEEGIGCPVYPFVVETPPGRQQAPDPADPLPGTWKPSTAPEKED